MLLETIQGQNVHNMLLDSTQQWQGPTDKIWSGEKINLWMIALMQTHRRAVHLQAPFSFMAWLLQAVQMPQEKCLRCKLSSSMTLEFTSHHITDSWGTVQPLLSVCQWKKNVLGENKAFIFPLLLTESVPMGLHTLAGTRLLHHPSIASLARHPPHQSPNLTGWHVSFFTANAQRSLDMVDKVQLTPSIKFLLDKYLNQNTKPITQF